MAKHASFKSQFSSLYNSPTPVLRYRRYFMSVSSTYGARKPLNVQLANVGEVSGGFSAPSVLSPRNGKKNSDEDADRPRLFSSSGESARVDNSTHTTKIHYNLFHKQSTIESSKMIKNTGSTIAQVAPPLITRELRENTTAVNQTCVKPLLSSPNSTLHNFDLHDSLSSDTVNTGPKSTKEQSVSFFSPYEKEVTSLDDGAESDGPDAELSANDNIPPLSDFFWLSFCFVGIVVSFLAYGLILEYATSDGRELDELSFLFVTSSFYALSGAMGRYILAEKPSEMRPFHFAVIGLTSMGSMFFSLRSLRYVIYPIQVLGRSCKPIPVMFMGALMGKKYPLKKYVNIFLIVIGVAMFMVGGINKKSSADDKSSDDKSSALSVQTQLIGAGFLLISLCFDGGTGAYEDKLMSIHEVKPFDLMFNIQLWKTIFAGIGLIIFNHIQILIKLVQDVGIVLVWLGLTGAMGQIFIFITIAKFGALTTSIIGLSRKILTVLASIYFYGHSLNAVQAVGLLIAIGAMVYDSIGKAGKKKDGHVDGKGGHGGVEKKVQKFEVNENDDSDDCASLLQKGGDIELAEEIVKKS